MRLRPVVALAALLAVVAVIPATGVAAEQRIRDGLVIPSFDGTPIVATLMLPAGASAAAPVPVVLQTHGWGGTREATPSAFSQRLLDNGYALLTWDSRGFGQSGGEAGPGGPEFEVRDAQALLDYLAEQPEIQQDGPGDPRVGWIGGSNAAGVQLNTAAVDDRVDAIVPVISWGDLVEDLAPNTVPKQSWQMLLYGAGAAGALTGGIQSPAGLQTGVYQEEIHRGFVETNTVGQLSTGVTQYFAERATTAYSDQITAPTLIVQGSIDTLFPLQDAFDNYRNLKEAGTEVKLMTYCGGHTITGCTYPGGQSGYPQGADGRPDVFEDRTLVWLDRWVKGDEDKDTGPEVEWQAQDGMYRGADTYPLPGTQPVTAAPVATGPLVGPGLTGGDGPANGAPAGDEELGLHAQRMEVLSAAEHERALLGVPHVQLGGSVMGLTAFAFFELVDVAPDGTRVTLDDQTMPLRLGNGPVDRELDLHGVSWMIHAGHSLELEVTTSSAQYALPRNGPFMVDLEATVTLPLTS